MDIDFLVLSKVLKSLWNYLCVKLVILKNDYYSSDFYYIFL